MLSRTKFKILSIAFCIAMIGALVLVLGGMTVNAEVGVIAEGT